MPEPKPRAIIALDLLRFACALLVVAFHYAAAFALAPSPVARALLQGLPVRAVLGGASWFGWIGVELFFTMSGCVIALSAQGSDAHTFLQRRALRLLPAAWICASTTLCLLAIAVPAPDLLQRWLASIAFWPSDIGIDPSYWTLPIELCFYLVIATGLGSGGTLGAIEHRARCVGLVSAAFWVIQLCASGAAAQLINHHPAQLLLAQHGCFFALGVTIWGMLRDGPTRPRLGWLALFTACGLIEIAAISVERSRTLGIAAGPIVPMTVFITGIAIMLAARRLQPVLQRYIGTRIAGTLGLMTYPLYLIHQQAGVVMAAALMRAGLSFLPAIAVTLVAALGFAWWVAMVAEPAARAQLRRLFRRSRALAPDTLRSASPPIG